jgi:acetylornithine deacetylase
MSLDATARSILEKLVSFDTTSYNSNLALVEYVQSYLQGYAIESQLVPDATGKKANLYATIGADPKAPEKGGVMLSGHTDVVPVIGQDWHTDPFVLYEQDNKLFARGSADMKGFIALVLSRVPSMLKQPLQLPFHLAFSYDEEIGCVGVRGLLTLLEQLPVKPVMCIVGEPTSMEVVIGHKGKASYRVEVSGHACHSGQAPLGVNAIDYAAQLVIYINQLARESAQNGPFDYDYKVPYTTLHTGTINGGTALNIVPNQCQFEFEIRYLAEQDPEPIVAQIELYAKQKLVPVMQAVAAEADIKMTQTAQYPGLLIEPDAQLVTYVKQLLNNQAHSKVIFGTEGGLFQQKLGIPTLVCGPGNIDQAHKANEFISLKQFALGGQFLDRLIADLAST